MMIKLKKVSLSPRLKKKIHEGFSRHSKATTGYDGMSDSVAFIANDKTYFAGVIVITIFWGALHVKYLYVEDKYRNQKIATQLMKEAFQYGLDNKCSFVFVETMSFQALEFYQKMGFELEFTRSGYKCQTSLHYLKRSLC